MIPLFYPRIEKSAIKAVKNTLKTKWLSQAHQTVEFEKELQKYIGTKNEVVTTNSGTSALHLAYILADIKNGDEVLTPVLTCLYGEETVLLPNGKTRKIKNLVKEKYNGDVISFNEKTNKLENKKVIGWYKNPIYNKDFIKISFKNANNTRSKYKKGVWLTNDHKILTINGYKRADKLHNNDKIITNYRNFNQKQKEFIYGSMLGDGCIRFGIEYYTSSRFIICHTAKQKILIDLASKVLNEFEHKLSTRKKYKQSKKASVITVKSSPVWNILRKKWYHNRKKILPNDLENNFSELSLAIWYMDDGCLQRNSVNLCSDCFSKKENIRLIKLLKDKFNIDSTLRKINRNNNIKYRIYIGNGNNGGKILENSNIEKFFRLITKYIPLELRYKVPKYISNNIKYNINYWDCGESLPFYDNVIITKNKKPLNRKDRLNYVYCIDVKDNHNFISKNIVCHNCVATNIPLLYLGAKPIFVDINKDDFNIDIEDLKRKITDKTKAIVAVDFGGMPAEIDKIMEIAKERNIPVIEDAAQSLGASIDKYKIGDLSNFTCFSFQAIKNVTTGDGGAIVLDKDMAERAKRLRWFGIDRSLKKTKDGKPNWGRDINTDIVELGYKYNMNDISAAMGKENLKYLEKDLYYRRQIANYYNCELKNILGLTTLKTFPYKKSSNWLYHILVERRDDFQKMMDNAGIEVTTAHIRNDIYTIFGGQKLDLPNMNDIEDKYISLPIHPKLKWRDVKYIVRCIKCGW